MRLNRRHLSFVTGLCLLSVVSLGGVGCAQDGGTAVLGSAVVATEDCTIPINEQDLVDRVIELVNVERTSRGLDPVVYNAKLSEIAAGYACEMIDGSFFAHTDPFTGEGPGERAIQAGYSFIALGENLAAGQRTAEKAMDDWMASTEGHRENILHPSWTEVGVAVRIGGEHGVYWVQEFGDPSIPRFAQLPGR